MDRYRLMRKAAGILNYLGTKEDFMDNMKEAIGADYPSDIAEFQARIKSGNLPDKLKKLLNKRWKELQNGQSGFYQ